MPRAMRMQKTAVKGLVGAEKRGFTGLGDYIRGFKIQQGTGIILMCGGPQGLRLRDRNESIGFRMSSGMGTGKIIVLCRQLFQSKRSGNN